MRSRATHLLIGVTFAMIAAACSPSDTDAAETTTTTQPETTTSTVRVTTTTEAPRGPTLRLEVSGWPTLQNGFHYEGWAIVDGSPVTTGKFNVEDGNVIGLDGEPIDLLEVEAIESATAIVITIEPSGDTDEVPADTHFLAGDVANGQADLTIGHAAAIGTDLSDAAGTFLLATPTDDDDSNELSGIWFIELPGPTASLQLPELAAGWRYEGWAVIDGVPLSSGTFVLVEGPDDAALFSGPNTGPPFPGEDYLVNAPEAVTFPTDLSGATVVISVEPYPDDDPAPFVLKPLLGTAAEDATDHQSYPLDLNDAPLPTGTAIIG